MFCRRFASQNKAETTPSFPSTGANRRSPPSCNAAYAGRLRALGLSVVTELVAGQWPARRRGGAVGRRRYLDRRDQVLPARLSDRRQMAGLSGVLRPALFRGQRRLPCEVIPAGGLILADRYGAELVRSRSRSAYRRRARKAMMLNFARAAALQAAASPRPAL